MVVSNPTVPQHTWLHYVVNISGFAVVPVLFMCPDEVKRFAVGHFLVQVSSEGGGVGGWGRGWGGIGGGLERI